MGHELNLSIIAHVSFWCSQDGVTVEDRGDKPELNNTMRSGLSQENFLQDGMDPVDDNPACVTKVNSTIGHIIHYHITISH
jgi:hypothetical protein